jgi:hypothetical protein
LPKLNGGNFAQVCWTAFSWQDPETTLAGKTLENHQCYLLQAFYLIGCRKTAMCWSKIDWVKRPRGFWRPNQNVNECVNSSTKRHKQMAKNLISDLFKEGLKNEGQE